MNRREQMLFDCILKTRAKSDRESDLSDGEIAKVFLAAMAKLSSDATIRIEFSYAGLKGPPVWLETPRVLS